MVTRREDKFEQAIGAQERELQKLESEIQEKRQLLARQKEALSLLQPLLVSVLGESTKVVTLELDSILHGVGTIFRGGKKEGQCLP
jgi:septal ring factor EnvC (AmiA/AmiB activator)